MIREWETYHSKKHTLRHFEKVANWPDNFVCVGDAVATFNPAFGQGMTQASMHALNFSKLLTAHMTEYPLHDFRGFAHRFQREAAQVAQTFWMIVEPEDLSYPSTDGPRTGQKAFAAFMMRHFWYESCRSAKSLYNFFLVSHGITPPEKVFMTPWFLSRVLLSILREKVFGNPKLHGLSA